MTTYRWLIKINKPQRKSKSLEDDELVPIKNQTLKYMNNYISVGCDALVTLNFHRQRDNLFFANRLLNKV